MEWKMEPQTIDIVQGAKPLALLLYGDESKSRLVYLLAEQRAAGRCDIPIFKLNGRLSARRSAILEWVMKQEAA